MTQLIHDFRATLSHYDTLSNLFIGPSPSTSYIHPARETLTASPEAMDSNADKVNCRLVVQLDGHGTATVNTYVCIVPCVVHIFWLQSEANTHPVKGHEVRLARKSGEQGRRVNDEDAFSWSGAGKYLSRVSHRSFDIVK
jgi:hypothetical protein